MEREWQPIDTAPRDGTKIIVYQGAGNGFKTEKGDIGIVGWKKQWMGRDIITWVASDCCDEVTTYENATHWMHLPNPPKE